MTVDEYIKDLPKERAAVIVEMRKFVRKHMPNGYRESIGHGMIWWSIPLEEYPNTYNKEPLGFVALAAQKNYNSIYIMNAYAGGERRSELTKAFEKAGKKLDMGQACIRFKTPDDLELTAIGKLIASTPPQAYIKWYESVKKK